MWSKQLAMSRSCKIWRNLPLILLKLSPTLLTTYYGQHRYSYLHLWVWSAAVYELEWRWASVVSWRWFHIPVEKAQNFVKEERAWIKWLNQELEEFEMLEHCLQTNTSWESYKTPRSMWWGIRILDREWSWAYATFFLLRILCGSADHIPNRSWRPRVSETNSWHCGIGINRVCKIKKNKKTKKPAWYNDAARGATKRLTAKLKLRITSSRNSESQLVWTESHPVELEENGLLRSEDFGRQRFRLEGTVGARDLMPYEIPVVHRRLQDGMPSEMDPD